MNLFVGAIALAFAVPAAAQSGSAQMDHSAHAQMQGGDATAPAHGDHQMPQGASHEGHAMKEGCCADKDGNGKMDCCEKMAAKENDQPSAPSQGH